MARSRDRPRTLPLPHWSAPAILAVFGGLNNGFNMIVVAEILEPLRRERILNTPLQEGFFVASIGFGIVLMMPAGAFLADKYGRRITVVVGESVVVCASLLQVFCSSFLALTLVRMIVGCGMALCVLLKPLYIAELCNPLDRGKILALFSTAFSVGVLLVSILGAVPERKDLNWRVLLSIGAVPSFVLVLAAHFYLEESPVWLDLVEGENEKRGAEDVVDEAVALKSGQVLPQPRRLSCSKAFCELFDSECAGPTTLTAFLTGMLLELDGLWMLVQYRNDVFSACGVEPHVFAVVLCSALLLINVVPGILVDSVGRRPLLKAGVAGSVLSKLVAAIGLSTGSFTGWPLALFVLLWGMFAHFGISVIANIIISELFEPQHRSVGMCFAFMCMLGTGILLNLAYRPAVEIIGHHGWMFIFLSASIAIAIPLLNRLPETRGIQVWRMAAVMSGEDRVIRATTTHLLETTASVVQAYADHSVALVCLCGAVRNHARKSASALVSTLQAQGFRVKYLQNAGVTKLSIEREMARFVDAYPLSSPMLGRLVVYLCGEGVRDRAGDSAFCCHDFSHEKSFSIHVLTVLEGRGQALHLRELPLQKLPLLHEGGITCHGARGPTLGS
eukprot:g2817.t1